MKENKAIGIEVQGQYFNYKRNGKLESESYTWKNWGERWGEPKHEDKEEKTGQWVTQCRKGLGLVQSNWRSQAKNIEDAVKVDKIKITGLPLCCDF